MKTHKNYLEIIFLALLFFAFLLPVVSLAQQPTPSGTGQPTPSSTTTSRLKNPLGTTSPNIPALVDKMLEGAMKIAVPIIALMLIYAGFLFVFAQGNKEKLSKAKTVLLYTLIGAAILIGAKAIATLIKETITGL